VEAGIEDEPMVRRAVRGSVPVRVREEEPVRVLGPYWSRHAALVAVGDDHVVVIGDDDAPLRASDGELRRQAAEAVSRVGGIPSSKLLADELEVVDAVRTLMGYRPETIAATARHVAEVAATSLSCDFAAVLVPGPDGPVISVNGSDTDCPEPKLCDELQRLADRVGDEPLLEQQVRDRGRLGRGGGLVTRYALGIGSGARRGTLVVGHDAANPRGFTLLCQRVGRALADAAEVLLSQAVAREELAAERDRFAREARTDDLTGLANRIAWTEALAGERKRRSRYRRPVVLMSVDVDRLKEVNDTYGHDAGDELLRAAAGVLVNSLRQTDLVARIGGDEFGILMPETLADAVAPVIDRIHAACRAWRGSHADLRLSLSIGWATPEPFGDLAEALRTADGRMYASKRAG
jgi:diguanylate cyclase (GGDEF)-like protein